MLYEDALRKRINDLAKERKITINKVATLAGMSPSALYSFIDRERHDLKSSTIFHICEGLDIELWEFYKDPVFKGARAE